MGVFLSTIRINSFEDGSSNVLILKRKSPNKVAEISFNLNHDITLYYTFRFALHFFNHNMCSSVAMDDAGTQPLH